MDAAALALPALNLGDVDLRLRILRFGRNNLTEYLQRVVQLPI